MVDVENKRLSLCFPWKRNQLKLSSLVESHSLSYSGETSRESIAFAVIGRPMANGYTQVRFDKVLCLCVWLCEWERERENQVRVGSEVVKSD